MTDATVSVLVHDEDDRITHVTSKTRTIPAKLRRYLEATYPKCGRKGRGNTRNLHIDHVIDYAEVLRTGEVPPTTEADTWRLCPACHALKTHHGWTVTGTPGNWDLVPPHPPDDPDPP